MKKLDPQRMLDTATSFFLAGERCAPDLAFGNYGRHSVNAPRIVCYALSVEIALKIILFLHTGALHEGHKLEDLYGRIPDSSRERLPYLGEAVVEISSYFERWRYAYESELLFGECDNPRRSFIECYREIRRLKPELVSVYEKNWGGFEPRWDYAWPELEIAQLEGR